jgi:hypothetical protein
MIDTKTVRPGRYDNAEDLVRLERHNEADELRAWIEKQRPSASGAVVGPGRRA